MCPFFPEDLGPSLPSFDRSHSAGLDCVYSAAAGKEGVLFIGVAGSGSSFLKILMGTLCGMDSCGRPFRKPVLSS